MANKLLGNGFKPERYGLEIGRKSKENKLLCRVTIYGIKLAPPSKRISLNQRDLKIIGAEIYYHHKKEKLRKDVIRINYLPTRNEVRIHSSEILYPGKYEVVIDFLVNERIINEINSSIMTESLREFIPFVDERELSTDIKLEIIRR